MAVRFKKKKKRQTNREKYFYNRPPGGQNTTVSMECLAKNFTDLLPTCIVGIFHFWCFSSATDHVKHHILIRNIYTVSTGAEATYTHADGPNGSNETDSSRLNVSLNHRTTRGPASRTPPAILAH